ncbi:MAG TPA: flagellar export protein FliJ [Verrucomicrobiae bacterium]|jgi:flagellar export protein FliJ|nr:flagellar export protein FliJ [Verrucomicrobiae bacterium]
MKAFNFPLESLRTLRQQRERTAQQVYARALVLCDGAMRVLQLAEEELNTGHAMLGNELKTGATASRLVNLRSWCGILETRRNECLAALAEARRRANDAFRLMTTAAREREALDRFHDKSQRAWQRAFQADEQKMFDEMAVQRQTAPAFENIPLLN